MKKTTNPALSLPRRGAQQESLPTGRPPETALEAPSHTARALPGCLSRDPETEGSSQPQLTVSSLQSTETQPQQQAASTPTPARALSKGLSGAAPSSRPHTSCFLPSLMRCMQAAPLWGLSPPSKRGPSGPPATHAGPPEAVEAPGASQHAETLKNTPLLPVPSGSPRLGLCCYSAWASPATLRGETTRSNGCPTPQLFSSPSSARNRPSACCGARVYEALC